MATLSVDLAYKDYRDVGVVLVAKAGNRALARPIRLGDHGLVGKPSVSRLVGALIEIAERAQAEWIFIDGPQGWKSPDNGHEHSRSCERELLTQGKTGLPGVTKPANYAGFTSFAVEVFDELARRDWPRLVNASIPPSRTRCAVESFPTSAWRSLGLKPLPGKSATTPADLAERIAALKEVVPVEIAGDLSHDEVQALISGLAGLALEDGNADGLQFSGVAPFELDGHWREGLIVNPRRAAFPDYVPSQAATPPKNSPLSTLERAIAIAAEAHAGQVDKAGAPYILHPIRVMLRCTSTNARIVGVLHDVIEDCGLTLKYLELQGFSKAVVAGVAAVTKRADEEGSDDGYFRFIRRAMLDPVGREVKRADLLDNLDISRIAEVTDKDRERLAKYQKALAIMDGGA